MNNFVFLIVPMLNPDGVDNGFYRLDSKGTDLNRIYHESTFQQHPEIFAVCELVKYIK